MLQAVLIVASGSASAQRSSDPLAAIVRCVAGGGFAVLTTDRLPDSVTARSVMTQGGNRRVSMKDGYRIILATDKGEPFVNLKVEQSDPGLAADDRAAVEAQMQMFTTNTPRHLTLERRSLNGADLLGMDLPGLDVQGPISFYSAFVPARSLIATLYVLNQAPERRAFASYAEYTTLRDQALSLVTGCLRTEGSLQH